MKPNAGRRAQVCSIRSHRETATLQAVDVPQRWEELTLLWIIIPIGLIAIVLSGLRIAKEYERGVLFRLGRYATLKGPDLYWVIPLGIDRVVSKNLRTRTVAAEQQETITRDSVAIKVNAVLWFRITDCAKAVIAVQDAQGAVYQTALTALAIPSASMIWTRFSRRGRRSTSCCTGTSETSPMTGALMSSGSS